MKKALILSLIFCFPPYLLSAHQKPLHGRLTTNQQIVTQRMASPSHAPRNTITHSHLSDQLRYLQWRQECMEQQFKHHYELLIQIKNMLTLLVPNNQNGVQPAVISAPQPHAPNYTFANTQIADVGFSSQQRMYSHYNVMPGLYHIPQSHNGYCYDSMVLVNGAMYANGAHCVPVSQPTQPSEQTPQHPTSQLPASAQVQPLAHQQNANVPTAQPVSAPERRFCQLVREWNRSNSTDFKECKHEKQ